MSTLNDTPAPHHPHGLTRHLTALDLTLLGVGAIIGAGVFIMTGLVAATMAGPAIVLSFILAAVCSLFAALSYTELATSLGGAGGAYSYIYTTIGEFAAWVVGWCLVAEYGFGAAAIASGWSAYFNSALQQIGLALPFSLIHCPSEGGIINLPAMGIVGVLIIVLSLGVKQGKHFNAFIVFVKLMIVALFIGVAFFHVDPANWHPWTPFGWIGVIQGGALIFFSYIGFDTIAMASEETVNPQRNLPIGILLSLVLSTLVYIVISLILTGAAHYTTLNTHSPVSDVLIKLHYHRVAGILNVGAVIAIISAVYANYYALTRLLYAASRDRLLPRLFSSINQRKKIPLFTVIFSGICVMLFTGLIPMRAMIELDNVGTLITFSVVCATVILLRHLKPNMPRTFKLPLNPLIPLLGIGFCIYLLLNLSHVTWHRFAVWAVIGVVIYFTYSFVSKTFAAQNS